MAHSDDPAAMPAHAARGLPAFARRASVAPLVDAGTTESVVFHPYTVEQCREALAWCRARGLTVCPRGAGHSYGDMPLNDGGALLDTRGLDRILAFDPETGRMVVEPGVQILDVYRAAHPHGFLLPASPSEGTITVAGAIANNVNGKDGWRAGNFGDQVRSLKLLTAAGEILEVDRERDREVFDAVCGGMGMLGVVVEATLELRRIATPYLETTREEVADVDALLAALARVERDCDFAVAWVDVYARGAALGRSVVHATRWRERPERAARYDRDVSEALERLATRRHEALRLHAVLNRLTSALLQVQRVSVRLFNRAYFAFCALRSRARASQSELFVEYNFFPNLRIPPAALVCGPHGYTVQVVVPREAARRAIPEMLRIGQAWPCPPVTTVLRLHRRDERMLSFSADGYSLNFEIHPKARHAARMRRGVDELVACTVRHGGRVHLAKDALLTPEQFRALFPRHEEFVAVKRKLDPEGLFSSDLFRRLFPGYRGGPERRRARARRASPAEAASPSRGAEAGSGALHSPMVRVV